MKKTNPDFCSYDLNEWIEIATSTSNWMNSNLQTREESGWFFNRHFYFYFYWLGIAKTNKPNLTNHNKLNKHEMPFYLGENL